MRFLATSCLLVGAWSFVRLDDGLSAACSFVVVWVSYYLLRAREGEGLTAAARSGKIRS